MGRTLPRGFTLLETIVAISLTAVVITIAGVALDAATTARAAIARHQATRELETRLRALLTDMLRHAPHADAVDEPLLRVARAPDRVALVFLSRGVVQPFGTGRTWRVTLSGGPEGVILSADPIGVGAPVPALHTRVAHLSGIEVSLLEQASAGDAATAWRSDWPVERARPALVRIDFRSSGDRSSLLSHPLVVALGPLEGAR